LIHGFFLKDYVYTIYDFWLVKTNASGTLEWSQTYRGAEDDIAYSLVTTSDGGYTIAGRTESSGAGGSDFWLVKTDENGNSQEFSCGVAPQLLDI
jgi:hypothetical protein